MRPSPSTRPSQAAYRDFSGPGHDVGPRGASPNSSEDSPSSGAPEGVFVCERCERRLVGHRKTRQSTSSPLRFGTVGTVTFRSGAARSLRQGRGGHRDQVVFEASAVPGRRRPTGQGGTHRAPSLDRSRHRTLGAVHVVGRSLRGMGVMESADALPNPGEESDITALIPIVRRVICARVTDSSSADDLVQETLVRVMGAAHRIEPGMLEPYAIVTARNVVASMWKDRDRHRRNQHRALDLSHVEAPDDELLRQRGRERRCHSAGATLREGTADASGPRGVRARTPACWAPTWA